MSGLTQQRGGTLYKSKLFALSIAYVQLVFSILLAATTIFAYVEFRATLGQFSQALVTTIVSTANLIEQIAEAAQTKQILVDDARATIVSSRKTVEQLRVFTQNQASYAPQYVAGMRKSAEILSGTGGVFLKLGDSMMFSVPTSLRWEGVKPSLVMGQPLEKSAQLIRADALSLKNLGSSLQVIASSFENDSKNLSAAIVDTSNNTVRLLDETEKTLSSLKSQDLPKAIAEMKSAAENLRGASSQVSLAESWGNVLLVAGLLLSGWCFLNSLSVLHLTRNQSI